MSTITVTSPETSKDLRAAIVAEMLSHARAITVELEAHLDGCRVGLADANWKLHVLARLTETLDDLDPEGWTAAIKATA